MHRLGCGPAAVSAIHPRAPALACKGGKRRDPAGRRCRPACAAAQCRDRPWREDSGGARGRRGSRARRQALPHHCKRSLPDHAADDRRPECMRALRVLAVASEIYPVIKTGGLADVAGALPIALKAEGIETRTLVPGYSSVLNGLETREQLLERKSFFGGTARLLAGSRGSLDLFVLDAPHLFKRPGNPYLSPEG